MFYDQCDFDVRCEWGLRGIEALAATSDVVVIVDVLSFSTCVEVATGRGAVVFPYRWRDASAAAFAQENGAVMAGKRGERFSLSPASMLGVNAGMKVVLPSPNGAMLSLAAGGAVAVCGCLRNCRAVAEFAGRVGKRIAVIAAGERWEDGSLRVAVEDWVGVGAIVRFLAGSKSPEALGAVGAFEAAAGDVLGFLRGCASGRELIERGFEEDVAVAAEVDCSGAVPVMREGAYEDVGK